MSPRHKNTRIFKHLALSCLTIIVLATSLIQAGSAIGQEQNSVWAFDLSSDTTVQWMQFVYDRIEAESISAPAAARLYGYVGVTMYESVLNGIPGNNSLAAYIDHMPDMPLPKENKVYDWPTVSNSALATVFPSLIPTAGTKIETSAFRDKIQRLRAKEVSETVINNSIAFGEEMGAAILTWIALDNFKETREMTYEMPTGWDGYWTPTNQVLKPVEPYWGRIRPFAMRTSGVCNVSFNLDFSIDPKSTFYAQADEVRRIGRELTDEQIEIARFWVDTPGLTGTPAGHWMLIGSQLIQQQKLTLDRASEVYAMLGIAVADSFISCWNMKYQTLLIRPESYIKKYIRRSWAPYIETPPFPEYPSGHSVVSGAAAEVLTRYFGVIAFTDSSHERYGNPARTFTSFEAAANEAAMSRLYGGIHYRIGIENGLRQGRCVGQWVNKIRLRPLSQGGN